MRNRMNIKLLVTALLAGFVSMSANAVWDEFSELGSGGWGKGFSGLSLMAIIFKLKNSANGFRKGDTIPLQGSATTLNPAFRILSLSTTSTIPCK